MLNGTNTLSVITSCSIFSCGSVNCPKPILLAGTWITYSKNAIPQLTRIAKMSGLLPSVLRCPYQANVMNTFEAARSRMVEIIAFIGLDQISGCGSNHG